MANKNFEVKHGLSVGGTERITAAGAGSFTDLALSGDLNITGDVNSVSVTDLDVTDKTITLGKGQTESNSGSSGIIIDGSSASMLWDESNDEFDFNKGINITGGLNLSGDIFGTSNFDIRSTGNIFNTYGNSSNVYFRTQDGTNRVLISSSGNLGIGETAPDEKLTVKSGNYANDQDGGIAIQAGASTGNHLKSAFKLKSNSSGQFRTTIDTSTGATAGETRESISILASSGNVGINTTVPQSKFETNLHSGADSSLMNANSVNDVHLIRAGFGQNAGSTTNAGAKWGLRFVGRNDNNYDNGKSGAIFGVSEDSLGYNRKVGLAFHTSSFDASHAERMRINADGNVGIGTASPDTLLRLDQDANSVAFKVTGGGNGVHIAEFVRDVGEDASININASGGKPQIQFVDANTFAMGVNSNSFEIADNTHIGTNPRFVILNTGYVGIGDTTPSSKLTVLGSSVNGGILVEDSSDSSSSPVIKVLGKRSDANKSQSFSGGIALQSQYTGGLAPSTKHTGTIYFGANHTDGTAANIAYAASISGYMTGDANSTTDMPMGINFHTGSTGRALGTANVTYGDERMRISGNGDVMLGNTVVNPASGFSNQKGFGYDFSHGTTEIAVDSDTTCLVLGRNHGNNGVMQTFRKQSTSFAEIGIEGGDSLYIQGGTTSGSGILLHGSGAKVLPARSRTSIDNAIDLGQSSRKWKKGWFYSLDVSDAAGNCSVGYEALNVVQANSGDSNTAMGFQALEKTTTGDHNVGVGYRAGMNNLSGVYNALFGRHAGYSITSGGYNTAIGSNSLDANTEGGSNTAIGYNTLGANTTASNNTAVGSNALKLNTTGTRNTAVGVSAIQSVTNGGYNDAHGSTALADLTTGDRNVGVGYGALANATTGDDNVGLGVYAGFDMTSASDNTFVGSYAGENKTTGNNNVHVGYKAGHDATDATNNVFIGANTQNDNAGTSNQVVIGNSARSQGGGKFTVGTSSSTYSYLTIGGTSWSGSSDVRLKKEITDSTAGLSFINDLRPITFKWKTKGEVDSSLPHYEEGSSEPVIGNSDSNVLTKHGFIAQEVKTAIDNHTGVKDGSEIWEENRDGIQNFSPTALIPMLVKAIQELEARVKELEG